ncbi:MAG: anti-sigma factor, partial [Nocardioidaceae bacterium]|nr:anti-sigma factor [Nocardioidaceae bacterium]
MHALSGAYAVDALDDAERNRFESHLTGCSDCQEEVAGLSETAALLGSSAAVQPPARVRDNILAQIQEVRPLPPLVQNAPVSEAPVSLEERRASRTRRLAQRVPLLVAAAAVLIMGIGALVLRPWASEDPTPGPQLTAAERVLADANATRVEKKFPNGAKATVIVSRSEGRAVIRTDGMAPAPEGKVYELWLQSPAGVLHSAG